MKRIKRFFTIFAVLLFMCSSSLVSGAAGIYVGKEYLDEENDSTNTTEIQIVEEHSAVIDVASDASKSVVSVVITRDVPTYEYYDDDSSFFPQRRQSGSEEQQVGAGSGFVVNADGLIITNRHVVSDEDASYTVIFNDGKKHEAKVLARDTLLDIAFLKIEATDLDPLDLGSSDDLKVGQRVIAIGNALGTFGHSVSSGIISGLERDIVTSDELGANLEQLDNVIQTDASINPGNSGGPLLDINGNVIGVNVARASDADNIGFAIPINVVRDSMERLNKDGKIERPQLGVRYSLLNAEIAKEYDLDIDYGALILEGDGAQGGIVPNSPASRAGLKEGDVILEIDGTKVDFENTLVELIQNKYVGDTIKVTYLRNEEQFTVEVVLDK